MAPGRVAINLVAGGGPDAGYGAPPLDHAGRYRRLGDLADALRARFPGPLYLGGASDDALALAGRAAETYLMWGETPEAIAARVAAMRARAGVRCASACASTSSRATPTERHAPPPTGCCPVPRSPASGRPSTPRSTAWARRA